MKERQNKILRFLLTNKDIVKIDEIASAFAIGKRTVSRDLDILEKWLSIRGVHLERKTNQGIRIIIFNDDNERILNLINSAESIIPEMDQADRQKFIILYILYHNREIKISEAANTFFVSDTCVWNDLNNIEKILEEQGITMLRQKGVGISCSGEESIIRLFFLKIFSELFSHKTLVNYLYSKDMENPESISVFKLKLFIKHFRITADKEGTFHLVSDAERKLGYRFTLSGEAFLYFYLITSGHRIRSGALIKDKLKSSPDILYKEAAEMLLEDLAGDMISGGIPEYETDMLALILQSLEIGENISASSETIQNLVPERIRQFSIKLLAEMEKTDNDLYYLDNDFETILNLSTASLVLRLQNNIPHWHDDWGENLTDDEESRRIKKTILKLLDSELGLKADGSDIQHLLFHFKAAAIKGNSYRKDRIRCIIFCFEGIGLASYLYSTIKRDIKEIDIIESTAVYKFDQKYLDSNNIDLVISTFHISSIKTPIVQLSLPLEKEKVKEDILKALLEINKRRDSTVPALEQTEGIGNYLPVDEVLSFIQDFTVFEIDKPVEIEKTIKIIIQNLHGQIKSGKILEKAFLKREKLGPLFLEEFNIRMLHCKSSAVIRPCGGIIRYKKADKEREKEIIFLAAPDPCPEDIRKMLSEITISTLENSKFRESLINDDIAGIRKKLLSVYIGLL